MRDERLIDLPADQLRAELLALRARVAHYERAEVNYRDAERRFETERERFELVVESSNDGIWDWALHRDEVFCSPRFAELLGCTEENTPRSAEAILERVHPEDAETTRAAIQRCLRRGEAYCIEHRLRTEDRGYRWFLSRGMSRQDARGHPVRFAGSICDIHESRSAQRALERSHATYQNLFETSVDAIVVTDLDGRIENVNRRFQDLVGYDVEALRGRPVGELTAIQWRGLDHEVQREVEARGYSRRVEKEIQHRDGHHVPVSIQTWRVDGARPQLFTLVHDHSPEHEAQHALQRSEDRLRIVADGLPARICYIDRELRLGFTNRKYRERYGLGDEDVSGRPVRDVIGPDIYGAVRQHIEMALAGQAVTFEREETLPSGRTGYVHSAYAPVFDEAGEVEGFYALLTDISEQKRVAEALASSEQRFRSLATGAPVAVFEADAQGRLIYANRYWEELVGLTIEEILGEGWIRMVHPDDIGWVSECWQHAVEHDREFSGEWRARHRNGELRWIISRSKPIRDEYDRVRGHVGMAIDVTDRRRAEEEARASAERLQAMADSVPVVMVFVDADERYQFNNAMHQQWYGLPAEEIRGKTVREIVGEDNYRAAKPLIDAALGGERVETEVWQTSPGEGERCVRASFQPQRAPDGTVTGYWLLAQDVTDEMRSRDRIRHLAYFDSMTELPNRQALHTMIEDAVEAGEDDSLAVLFFDVDRFKQLNETLGHPGGDTLLRGIAERLRGAVRSLGLADRKQMPPISRYGGDEFALLLPGPITKDQANAYAEMVVERLAEPFEIDERRFGISVTAGYAVYPDDADVAEELLRKADAAMAEGKRSGRARIVAYSERLDRTSRRKTEIEARLRAALREGGFAVLYQVQKSARGGAVCGAEALLRWRDPELGVVEPGEFVPVAEDTGLIVPIGDWVFAQVCEQCRAWDEAGFQPLRVGVNVSARQLRELDLGRRFEGIVERAGIDPGRIELEITESALIDDGGNVASVIEELRQVGFQLALDDFGTGYSSLSYLRRFPLDRLKIDQSFVAGIPNNRADCELTGAVIAMAHNLRLEVVAEGIESRIQADFLARQGCDELQGYLLGRAEPGHKFARRLELVKPLISGEDAPEE